MSDFDPASIAERLFRHQADRQRFRPLPHPPGQDVLDLAYTVQDRLIEILSANGRGDAVGYKIGLTTPRMQQMCGIDHPIAGTVMAARVHASPAKIRLRDFVRLGIECEIAVKLRRPLGVSGAEDLPLDRVHDHVGAVAAAFELVEDRGADYSKGLDLYSVVAENSWNAGIVLGPEQRVPQIGSLAGALAVDGVIVDRGDSSQVLGHPLAAVVWLAKHLAARGRELRADEWIMTGSIVPTRFAAAGERYHFALGDLAPVELVVVAD